MTIELTKKQVEKFEEWKKTFEPLPHIGMIGGHFSIEVTFTAIGDFITAKNWKGDEIDLSEDNF